MAKDPAVLLYTSDFLTGTMTMTNEQVGKYIRLLCLQHQKDGLTEEDMLNICITYDKHIYSKFTHADGVYFNDRMRQEKVKRAEYSKSRSGNRKGKHKEVDISKSYVNHMEDVNENTLLSINEWGEKYSLDLKWIYDASKSLSVGVPTVQKLISNFKLHLNAQKTKSKTEKQFLEHFMNWARKQKGVNQPSIQGHHNGLMGN